MQLRPIVRPIAVALVLLAPTAALAESAAEKADALNSQGKSLFAEAQGAAPDQQPALFERAYAKFKQATEISPEGRFFFNVCYTLNFLKRYDEAIKACEQVEPNGADQALIDKTNKALASLRQKAGGEPGPGPGPGPGPDGTPPGPDGGGPTSDGSAGPGTGPGGAPTDDPFVATASAPPDAYTWSLGAELGGAINLGLGNTSDEEFFSAAGVDLRMFANFLLSQPLQLGLQGYVGIANFEPGVDNPLDDRLSVVDVGGAFFKGLRLAPHLYLTPLVGLHLSTFKIDSESNPFLAAGARLEGSLSYVFGLQGEHALGLHVGANVYGAASGGDIDPALVNLDKSATVVTVAVGYQFRFATPFFLGPVISLE